MKILDIQGWLKKKQEMLAVVGLVLLIILLIYFGLQTQQKYFSSDEPAQKTVQKRVKLSAPKKDEQGDSAAQGEEGERKATAKSYFLAPSPAELITLVKEIASSEIPVPREKYENLRIVWPTYFFKIIEEGEQEVKVMFDTSEDGFGVNIISGIDHLKYPEILTASPYQKIWLAGEIEGIDPEGTGTIYMLTEHVRFREELEELGSAQEEQQKE